MIEAKAVINNCYILQEPVVSDGVSDYWRASAMFSATQFLVRFFHAAIPGATVEEFRQLVIRTYGVANDAVLDIVEADRYDGRFFVSSEYGGSMRLRDLFGTGLVASLDHVCRYAIELAKGLDAFHKAGVAYGTLTADCIWVSREDGAITGLRFMKPGTSCSCRSSRGRIPASCSSTRATSPRRSRARPVFRWTCGATCTPSGYTCTGCSPASCLSGASPRPGP